MRVIIDEKYLVDGEIRSIVAVNSRGYGSNASFEIDRGQLITMVIADTQEIRDPSLPDDATVLLEKERTDAQVASVAKSKLENSKRISDYLLKNYEAIRRSTHSVETVSAHLKGLPYFFDKPITEVLNETR